MEFKKTTYNLNIYGETVEMKKPTVRQIAEHQQKSKECEDDPIKQIDCTLDFLHELGMPKEICNQLESEHAEKIITEIISHKKK